MRLILSQLDGDSRPSYNRPGYNSRGSDREEKEDTGGFGGDVSSVQMTVPSSDVGKIIGNISLHFFSDVR